MTNQRLAKPSLGALAAGVAAAIVGGVLLVWPDITLLVFSQLAGWAMGAAGFIGAIEEGRSTDRRGVTIVRYIAIGVTGVMLLLWPGETIVVITVLAGVWLVIDGGGRILGSVMASSPRSEMIGNALGVLEVLLGIWVMARPVGGIRASAIVVGVGLIIHGIARVWDAFGAPRPEAGTP